jgi:tetratricopeptide (TPR) repeat protein
LQNIFDVFVKTQAKVGSASGPRAAGPISTAAPPRVASPEEKANAEKHKQAGNAQMSGKSYDQAIESYTRAIALDASNPVYYSNRAAAYASKGDHSSAVLDAEQAIEVDPSFVKAYSRLGRVLFSGLLVKPLVSSLVSSILTLGVFFFNAVTPSIPSATTQQQHPLFAEVSSLTHQMQTSNLASQTQKSVFRQTTSHLLSSRTTILPHRHQMPGWAWAIWLVWPIC